MNSNNDHPVPARQNGVTLIELIIVVAIIGILATVVVPGYSRYITEQRRLDAHHLLQANAQRLQRCLTLVGAYNGGCNIITESSEGHYTLTAPNIILTPQTWTLRATPATDSPQQKDTDCKTITLNHIGTRGATGDDTTTCW